MERKKQNERAVELKRDPYVFVKSIKALSPDTVEERSSCERRVQSLSLSCGTRTEIHTQPCERKLNWLYELQGKISSSVYVLFGEINSSVLKLLAMK